MLDNISLQELFDLQEKDAQILIDVRSPKEYTEMTIPGSLNIPIFNDEERAEIGILYKQVGKDKAKERGLEIFSAKLPAFIHKFKQITKPITVFCWRGGMRSKTAATVLGLMGIRVNRLNGGIRSYRKWVTSELEKEEFSPTIYVLNGHTGTGKTIILNELQKNGHPVMDLEGMANHRGSIFGHIGQVPNNQKRFESLLVREINKYEKEPYVILEGESKRIGKVMLPDFFYKKKEQGIQIFIDVPIEERVRNILVDYQPQERPEQFQEAFEIIKKRIHTPVATKIETDLQSENYASAVRLLLEHYYDPRYLHTEEHFTANQIYRIKANTTNEAVQKVEGSITKLERVNCLG